MCVCVYVCVCVIVIVIEWVSGAGVTRAAQHAEKCAKQIRLAIQRQLLESDLLLSWLLQPWATRKQRVFT